MANEPSTGSPAESERSSGLAPETHGSRATDAAAYLRRSANTVESLSGSPSEIRRQGDQLVEWAEKRALILPDTHFVGLAKREKTTTEHEVYYRDSDKRAVKRTYPGAYGFAHGPMGKRRPATPLYYLERIELMNREFGSDILLEGIGFGESRFEQRPYIVISQCWVRGLNREFPYPSLIEISEFMKSLGFTQMENSQYDWQRIERAGSEFLSIVVLDAKHENFIKSTAGIVPIDLIVGVEYAQRGD